VGAAAGVAVWAVVEEADGVVEGGPGIAAEADPYGG